MVIARLNGGLGNQMFQIALGTVLEIIGKNVLYDNYDIITRENVSNMTKACDVFDLNLKYANEDQVAKMSDKNNSVFNRIRRKVLGRKETHYYEKVEGQLDNKIFKLENAYLDGFWQTEKYFFEYKREIYDLFRFKSINDKCNLEFIDSINNTEVSISIHIRLGDYETDQNKKVFGGICTKDYYIKSINYFMERYNNPVFYIFSNDKKFLNDYRMKCKFFIVDCNDEKNAWKDMYLMSICKHNIIANSSFSWWGGYLNKYEHKTIIAPKKWLNIHDMPEICPDSWVRI